MIRVLIFAMCAATPLKAQEFSVDRNAVEACFAGAATGETTASCVGAAAETCMDTHNAGYTTQGMAFCMRAETEIWDEFLNSTYQELHNGMRAADADEFAGEVSLADSLRDAQRAWITFRDAECAFEWARFQGGTMRSLVSTSCKLNMTATRTFELRNHRSLEG